MSATEARPATVISVTGLTRRFGNLVAVDSLELEIEEGEVFGFLGPNGAGKSTLIRMLTGLLLPSAGSIRVLDFELPRDIERLRPHVGYMTQRFSLYEDLSVQENLEFAAEIFGIPRKTRAARVDQVLEEYELGERREQRPATLSGGWKQRLALATATIHDPRLLFLDEPTAGVDPERRRIFWEKLFEIAARGVTVLVSTHYMDEASRCHRLCMMRNGKRAALGAPDELTGALAGRVVEIEARPPERVIALLQTLETVASATQMGDRIHVLLAPGAPRSAQACPALSSRLESAGFAVTLAEPATPNLEDAFVALTLGEKLIGSGAEPL